MDLNNLALEHVDAVLWYVKSVFLRHYIRYVIVSWSPNNVVLHRNDNISVFALKTCLPFLSTVSLLCQRENLKNLVMQRMLEKYWNVTETHFRSKATNVQKSSSATERTWRKWFGFWYTAPPAWPVDDLCAAHERERKRRLTSLFQIPLLAHL